MTEAAPTLNDVFRHEGEGTAGALRDSDKLAAVAESVAREAGHGEPGALAEQAIAKLPALLDVPLGTILARAWSTSQAFRGFLDKIRTSGEQPVRLPLREHTIASTHHPAVEVLVNEKLIDTLDFEIKLTLTLKGAVLEARQGRVRALHTGECTAAGEIRFEGVSLIKRAAAPVRLPGVIELDVASEGESAN